MRILMISWFTQSTNLYIRLGLLVLGAHWDIDNIEITHINDPFGDEKEAARLVMFNFIDGHWSKAITNDKKALVLMIN